MFKSFLYVKVAVFNDKRCKTYNVAKLTLVDIIKFL